MDKSRAEVEAAERELEVIDTRKRRIQAALSEANANAQLARLNLSYTELRSPIAGVVGNRMPAPAPMPPSVPS